MIGSYAAFILWWGMTVFAFAAMIMLLIDAITFLGGRPDRTITNTFQRFFGGSKESWRSAMFGFIVGTIMTHVTGWGAIPPLFPSEQTELKEAKAENETLRAYTKQLQDANSNLKRALKAKLDER